MPRRAIVTLILAATLGACGGASYSDEVIGVEAAWLCDLARFVYDDAVDIDAGLYELLDSAGVARTTYDTFKAHIDDDARLRERVAESFDATCGEG